MWSQLKNMPPILVGQNIINCLDLKSIVKLETALASKELIQTYRSFLRYSTKVDFEVLIPDEIFKLKWLQAHDFPIKRAIVFMDTISATFESNMIQEIELLDNYCMITRTTLSYLPNGFYEKVTIVSFDYEQDVHLMEEMFSQLHNLRELVVNCLPDGWILSALQALQIKTNNKVLIEKICICSLDVNIDSVAEMVKCCPKLQTLYASFSITEDSLLALSTHCPLLNELDIQCISKISTEQSAALCAPALSCIHSTTTPYDPLDHESPNYAMGVHYMTELQELHAFSPIDHLLLPLFSQYCLKLESIEIQCCSTTTPIQLLQLTQNCRNLHSIELFKDNLCTDELVIEIIKHCSNLQKLYLSSDSKVNTITDNSLLALSEHSSNLYELDIHYCIQITEAAILQFIHNCKHLHILKVPLNCLSEDTVLTLPAVTVSKNRYFLTLTFDID